MSKQSLLFLGLACAGLVHAHTGHGLPGTAHWHAEDALPLLGLAVATVAGLWLARRR